MTTLIAQRPRHRTGRTVAVPETPATAPEPDLILWRAERDGFWTGELDLLEAGTIRRTGAGYAVTGWDGSPEGVFPTLAAAQLSLEPAHRARLREQAEQSRHGLLATAAAVAGLTALAAAATTGLLTAFPL
jgi:hypothetical protein